jgi:hypothetical protein
MKKIKRRNRDTPKIDRKEKGGPVFMRSPLNGIPPEVLKRALKGDAAQQIEAFPELLNELGKNLREYSALHLLAISASYNLMAEVNDSGVEVSSHGQLLQHHVELLQAIALTIPSDELGARFPTPLEVEAAFSTIRQLAEAYHRRRYATIDAERDSQERAFLSIQESLRLHTQIVRNWSHFSDVVARSFDLYGPLNDRLFEAIGFSASDLLSVARQLVSNLEDGMNRRLSGLHRVFREGNSRRAVKAYYKGFPELEGDPDKFLASIGQAPFGYVKKAILVHSDQQLVRHATGTAADVAQSTGILESRVAAALDALSLSLGSLVGNDIDQFFMANPVWTSPIITIGSEYFCCAPQSTFSHIHDIMRGICERAGLSRDLERRRASYLENETHAILERALPGADLKRNVRWHVGDQVFETDHTAVLDATLIIVEDKSGALTGPALRGGRARVARHIKELIEEPSEQSSRLESLMRQAQRGNADSIKALEPFAFPLASIVQIIRLSITLDDFSAVSSNDQELKDAGLVREDVQLAPTMGIADFGIVADITETPPFFIHYLLERSRIQKALEIDADEADFLGTYLATGFNISGIEKERGHLRLTGMSASVDHYYNSADAGVAVPKPAPQLTPAFRRLVDRIAAQKPPQWSVMTTALLKSADYTEQVKLDMMLAQLREKVIQNWRDPKHDCSLVCIPPETRDTLILHFVIANQLWDKRKPIVEQICADVLARTKRQKLLAVGHRTDDIEKPYEFLFFATAKGEGD